MDITGACHCGNISYTLIWPGDATSVAARACLCSFCTAHGARYTSHTDASLRAAIKDETTCSMYRFGTQTADFYICTTCGCVPFVTSEIDGKRYAVVNVNTFQSLDGSAIEGASGSFDGEAVGARLERRSQGWIPDVTVTMGAG